MSLTQDRRKIASLGMLSVLLITPFFVSGGGTSPSLCYNQSLQIPNSIQTDPAHLQCGEAQINVASNSNNGQTAIIFSPPFSQIPKVRVFLETGGIADIEHQVSFDDNVSITSKVHNTIAILNMSQASFSEASILPSPHGYTVTPLLGELQMQMTTISGGGTLTVWLQGFDCNVDQLGDGVTAWETLGSAVKTPGIAIPTANTFNFGSIVALNTTLIQDIGSCPAPFNANYVLVRVVAQTNSALFKTFTVTKVALSLYADIISEALTVTINANIPSTQMIVTAIVAPQPAGLNVAFFWEAQT